jgi:surface polysaccharide O-acyltransferase-like enzyme
MTNPTPKFNKGSTPKWFIPVAVLALLWNLMGVMAFVGQMMMTAEMLAELSQAEQTFYANVPWWATMAFACAVCGGALGSLALLMKNSLAEPLLILSLAGVAIQMFHSFVISNSFEVFGPSGAIMPAMVVIIAIALVRLATKAKINHWLN